MSLLSTFRAALSRPLPGATAHARLFPRVVSMPDVIPEDARHSAVLALLHGPEDDLRITLIQRTADRGAHSRQIGLPGGGHEAIDESLLHTAMRETTEELGLPADSYEVLGALTKLYIPVSRYWVHPFLAYSATPPQYRPAPDEVAHVLEVPLAHLLLPDTLIQTDVSSPAMPDVVHHVFAYRLPEGELLWGATAMIVSEVLAMAGEA